MFIRSKKYAILFGGIQYVVACVSVYVCACVWMCAVHVYTNAMFCGTYILSPQGHLLFCFSKAERHSASHLKRNRDNQYTKTHDFLAVTGYSIQACLEEAFTSK